MTYKINISIEKTAIGYTASCPDLAAGKFQEQSLETVFNRLKEAVEHDLQEKEINEIDKPVWEFAQDLIEDMTEEEINQLPSDGATQHDHYIYGSSKKDQ